MAVRTPVHLEVGANVYLEVGAERTFGFPDRAKVVDPRAAILDAVRAVTAGRPVGVRGWPPRYAARRIARHVPDHAREIQDRGQ